MQSRLETLLEAVAEAEKSALCLDFDGTLAPFRVDPMSVRPWAGVTALLDKIQETGRTRITIISGRPAEDVAARLGTRITPEIWGLHGAERRFPDGRTEQEDLLPEQKDALAKARSAIVAEPLGFRLEEKHNSVGLHWRGIQSTDGLAASLEGTKRRALALMEPYGSRSGLRLLQFDGGLELRAGRDKGAALALVLDELPRGTPVAYLGDDATDEDAFRALGERGLGVLVRRKWRVSDAKVWLRPPVQLRRFLRDWLAATTN
jgi:trehalose-phosphatase